MKKIEFLVTEKGSKKYEYNKITWELDKQLDIEEFLRDNSQYNFVNAGKIVKNPKSTCGFKIKMNEEFEKKKFVIYLLVVDGKIVKGGKSKNPLPLRTYNAGTENNWTMKGSPSETNYVYSQIFRSCLKKGIDVNFYCFAAPFEVKEYNVFGEKKIYESSPYEEYEKTLNNSLKKKLGKNLIGEGKLLIPFKN
jgi:hypothetical protein